MYGGILGKKLGMTQIFDDDGNQVPVTAIEAGPCRVLQVKTIERDGYRAAQLGFDDRLTPGQWKKLRTWYEERKGGGDRRRMSWSDVKVPEVGHLLQIDEEEPPAPKKFVREVSLEEDADVEAGAEVTVATLEGTDRVDVTGISKGRGFAGMTKRFGAKRGPMTHGSKNHWAPGSIGNASLPGRVIKGKTMPGQMGNEKVTVRNLEVKLVDPERNVLLVKGGVPGKNGGYLLVRPCLTER